MSEVTFIYGASAVITIIEGRVTKIGVENLDEVIDWDATIFVDGERLDDYNREQWDTVNAVMGKDIVLPTSVTLEIDNEGVPRTLVEWPETDPYPGLRTAQYFTSRIFWYEDGRKVPRSVAQAFLNALAADAAAEGQRSLVDSIAPAGAPVGGAIAATLLTSEGGDVDFKDDNTFPNFRMWWDNATKRGMQGDD